MDIKEVKLQWFVSLFIKRLWVLRLKNEIMQNKPIIRKFEKRKEHSSFIDNIWRADLADMQLLSKFNKGIILLLCVLFIVNMLGLFL